MYSSKLCAQATLPNVAPIQTRPAQVARCVSNWSAHDFVPGDMLPYIGYLHPATSTIFTGTGFGKWGLAGAAGAANMICDLMENRHNDYYSAVKVRDCFSLILSLVTAGLLRGTAFFLSSSLSSFHLHAIHFSFFSLAVSAMRDTTSESIDSRSQHFRVFSSAPPPILRRPRASRRCSKLGGSSRSRSTA